MTGANDNCPLEANGPNEEGNAGVGIQADMDGDMRGNACDPVDDLESLRLGRIDIRTKTSKLTLKGLLDDLDDFKATFELGLDLDPRNDDPKNNDPNKLDPDDPNFYDLNQPVLRVRVLALRDPDLDLADPNLDPNGPNVTRFEKVFTLGECGKRKDDPLDPNQFLLLLNCKSETVPRARAKFRTAKGNDFFPRRFKFAFQARDVPSSLVDPNSIHYGVVVTTGPIDRAVLIFCEEPKKLRSGELNLKCRGPSP
ncbi:MAG: hypothetical protein O7F10_12500, partial [Deltaproteobacteria bacterium]|nr:hypothetical protein [Deltaproteobacteria bacterium]